MEHFFLLAISQKGSISRFLMCQIMCQIMSIFDEAEGFDHDLVETLNGILFHFFIRLDLKTTGFSKHPIFLETSKFHKIITLLYIFLEDVLVLKTKFY